MQKNACYINFFENKNSSNLKEKAIRGAGSMIFARFTQAIIVLSSQIFLARLLSPTDFGLVAMVLTIHSLLQIIRNGGLLDATVQSNNINQKLISNLFWINVGFGTFLMLFFISISPLVSKFFREPKLTLIIIFISTDYFFGGLCAQHRALLRRSLEMGKWACIDIVSMGVSFSVAIVLAYLGFGYWALVARWVVLTPVQALMSWILCPWKPNLPSLNKDIVPFIKFGIELMGSFFVEYIMVNVEKILIGRFLGAAMLGYYNRAYTLYEAPAGQIASPISGVAISALSRINDDLDRYKRYYAKAFGILSLLLFPISFILILTGHDIVLLLFGKKWKIAGDIFSILGFGIGMQVLYETNNWIHVSLAKNRRRIKWSLIASSTTIILSIIGIKWGVYGVAVARAISLHLLLLPSIWYAGKPINLGISFLIRENWKIYASSAFAALISWVVFFKIDMIATVFADINIILRLIILTIFYLIWNVITIFLLYGNIQIIKEFFSLIHENYIKKKL